MLSSTPASEAVNRRAMATQAADLEAGRLVWSDDRTHLIATETYMDTPERQARLAAIRANHTLRRGR